MSSPLDKYELLAELSSDERDALGSLLEVRSFGAGQVVFLSEDETGEMYLIAEGRVDVKSEGHTLGELGAGEVLGAMSPVVVGRRECDARASADSILLVLTREGYLRLRGDYPAVALKLQEGVLRSVATLVRAALLDRRAG